MLVFRPDNHSKALRPLFPGLSNLWLVIRGGLEGTLKQFGHKVTLFVQSLDQLLEVEFERVGELCIGKVEALDRHRVRQGVLADKNSGGAVVNLRKW